MLLGIQKITGMTSAHRGWLLLSSEIKLLSTRMLNCPALLSHPHYNHYKEEKL
jgi:hypothetical protein